MPVWDVSLSACCGNYEDELLGRGRAFGALEHPINLHFTVGGLLVMAKQVLPAEGALG